MPNSCEKRTALATGLFMMEKYNKAESVERSRSAIENINVIGRIIRGLKR